MNFRWIGCHLLKLQVRHLCSFISHSTWTWIVYGAFQLLQELHLIRDVQMRFMIHSYFWEGNRFVFIRVWRSAILMCLIRRHISLHVYFKSWSSCELPQIWGNSVFVLESLFIFSDCRDGMILQPKDTHVIHAEQKQFNQSCLDILSCISINWPCWPSSHVSLESFLSL